jgi:hypothetical protein
MTVVGVGVGALALVGCSGDRTAAASKVAVTFVQAVSSADGSRACALLSSDVAQTISQNAEKPCPQAVLEDHLPHPAPIVRTQAYGQQAFVVTKTDTLFLSKFPSGWKVIGAGCQPQGDKPYDCTVSGG